MAIETLASYPMPDCHGLPNGRLHWQLQPQRAVLLIHDLQEYFLSFYGTESRLIGQLLDNVAKLADWARNNQLPVVYTAQNRTQTAAQRGLLSDAWGPGLTCAPEFLQQINSRVRPKEGDHVLEKWRYSAFQRSELGRIMAQAGRDQIIICGVYAHIGCHATALEAFMNDIQPFAVIDAQADFSEQHHRQAMALLSTTCGRVVDTATVLKSGIHS